ncbi:hypothetical protein ACFPVY_04275 [Flavobacterium qiangtangense]|uniref:Uncharacterized protein n=1 Tax=Flavobacterium qiangtangense TaxID=1442595 RepID=A0ABW1PLB3_9FLAO
MEAIYIEEFGQNLNNLFVEKIIEAESGLNKKFEELEKTCYRFSPKIGAIINGREFTVEVNEWIFYKDGKVVCYLDTMLDIKGRYFYINSSIV